MEKIVITKISAICGVGRDIQEIFNNVLEGKIVPHKINFKLPEINNPDYNLRCNRILLHCMNSMQNEINDLITKYGKKRIGIVVGTTNSGIEEFEKSGNLKHVQFGNPAEFLSKYLKTENFYASVSTACTSGAKAFSTAVKLLNSGICDAVITGGTEPLASLPHYGFGALEVLSSKLTNPFSKNRDGMNIGEGGALFILEKNVENGIEILGVGETSDAYHSATPDPDGTEAVRAIEIALNQAKLKPADIDYINLHGTGTLSNDTMEANAVYKIFNNNVFVSSTKPLTGHCLGASASIELALCCQMLTNNPKKQLLPHIFDGQYDKSLPEIKLVEKGTTIERLNICMSNSFGFGGTNAAIIIGNKK